MGAFTPDNDPSRRKKNLEALRNAVGGAWGESKVQQQVEGLQRLMDALGPIDLCDAFRSNMDIPKSKLHGTLQDLFVAPTVCVQICLKMLETLHAAVLMEAIRSHITTLYAEHIDIAQGHEQIKQGKPGFVLPDNNPNKDEGYYLNLMTMLYFIQVEGNLFLRQTEEVLSVLENDLPDLASDLLALKDFMALHPGKIRSCTELHPNATPEEIEAHKKILAIYSTSNQICHRLRVIIPNKAMGDTNLILADLDKNFTKEFLFSLLDELENLGYDPRKASSNLTHEEKAELRNKIINLRNAPYLYKNAERDERVQAIKDALTNLKVRGNLLFDKKEGSNDDD